MTISDSDFLTYHRLQCFGVFLLSGYESLSQRGAEVFELVSGQLWKNPQSELS